MRISLCLLFAVLFFSSCNQRHNEPPVVGSLDTAAIANDTAMQLGMESSYEVHHSVVINPTLVYDILSSGTRSKGDYVILRRAEKNNTDTVARGERFGEVIGFAGERSKNGKDNVQFYLQKTDSTRSAYAVAWEFDRQGKGVQVYDKGLDSIAKAFQKIFNESKTK